MKKQRTDEQKRKEGRNLFLLLVVLPLGIGGMAWIWSRWGFVYALLFAVIFFPIALLTHFLKK